MQVLMPSPAVAIVGRHNSGKTTVIVKLIEHLTEDGFDVGSVKHHSHVGFDIDIPGKDSYRHRAAGTTETVIAAPGQMARVKTIDGEVECSEILASMPGHDIVIVEGYRKSGLPTIEIMRAANPADAQVARVFLEQAERGVPLTTDPVQDSRVGDALGDLSNKMLTSDTVAVVSDMPDACHAAGLYGIPCFGLDDITGLAAYLKDHYTRPKVTVAIQAGGESKRMGRSKATVPFAGRPLISRMVERMLPAADHLMITTNEPEQLSFLADEFPDVDIALVPDELDTRGAMQGLYTALKNAETDYVAVVACDMLLASPRLVVAEATRMAQTDAAVVVPVNKHGYEPFHALYRKSGCMDAVRAAVERGETRAQALFDDVEVCRFPQDQVLEIEPMGGCFINANTPEQLAAFEQSLLEA